MNWNSDSFELEIPGDIVIPLVSHLGYEWNTLSKTFKYPQPRDERSAMEWYSSFKGDEKEQVDEVLKHICSPSLVSDVMHVKDDIVAIYRVLVKGEGGDNQVLLITETGDRNYSCSLKKSGYMLYEELFEIINLEHPYWETPFAFQLERRDFMVLNAITDLNQRYRYSALLEQRPYDRKLRISDLERTLEVSSSKPDWRWTAPFVISCTPRLGEIPRGKSLLDSLILLAKAGFIYMDNDQTQIALSESGKFYYDSISRKYSILNINRVSYDASGNHVGEGAMFISTDKFLWTLDLGWLSGDKITLSSLGESVVEEIIEDMFIPTGKPSKTDAPIIKREEVIAFETSGPEMPRVEDEKEEFIYCRECGKQIPLNSKFCKHCGTKLK